jgi:hypothetical protein
MRRPCRGLRCGAGAAGLSARRWLSSGSRGIRGRWENRCYPSLDPLAGLASQVVGTSLLPPSPWPSPAWRSRASRSSRGSHPKMRSGGLRGLRSRPELLLPPGKSARFDIGLPRCSRNRAASFLSWDSYGGGERIAASRHPSPLHRSRSGVHSHRHCWRLRRRGGHPRRMFRPRGFAPPRRLPPPERSRACFIPLPILGFAAFRAPLRSRWHPKMPRSRRSLPSPRRSIRTPRRMFPAGSRTASPRPLPPCRFDDFEALLHHRVRYACRRLPDHLRPSFLGFVPPSRSFRTATGSLLPSAWSSAPREASLASHRAASPRSEDHERPMWSGSLQGLAFSVSRSSPGALPRSLSGAEVATSLPLTFVGVLDVKVRP